MGMQQRLGPGRATLMAGLFALLMERKQIRRFDPSLLALEFMGPMMAMRMVYLVMSNGTTPPGRSRPSSTRTWRSSGTR